MPPHHDHFVIVLSGLFVFGILYNHIITKAKEETGDCCHGYMAFIVAGGCLITIIGWRLCPENILHAADPLIWILACFAASGLPMIIGSTHRHVRNRVFELETIRQEQENILRLNGEIFDKTTK